MNWTPLGALPYYTTFIDWRSAHAMGHPLANLGSASAFFFKTVVLPYNMTAESNLCRLYHNQKFFFDLFALISLYVLLHRQVINRVCCSITPSQSNNAVHQRHIMLVIMLTL